MRDSFVIHTAYAEKFKRLTDEQFGMLVRLLIEYQITGEIHTISDATVAFAFDIARVDMDITNQRYEEVCEKRRIAGSLGGQAKVANASKSKQMVAKGSKSSKTYHKRREEKIREDKIGEDKEISISNNTLNNDLETKDIEIISKEKSIKENPRYFPDDDLLEKTFADFREMRKKIKKPMTDRAITLLLNKLGKLSSDPSEQVKILEQSIINCWQDIYELKDQQRGKQTKIQSIEDVWANVH